MRKDEREKTENEKKKKKNQQDQAMREQWKNEKRWKAKSRVGDNMRSGKERKKVNESQEDAFEGD